MNERKPNANKLVDLNVGVCGVCGVCGVFIMM
jgi:hypothetical protein